MYDQGGDYGGYHEDIDGRMEYEQQCEAEAHEEEALMWLRKRTQDRIDRGVEGTSVK